MFVSHDREKLINAIVYFTKYTNHCHKLKLFKLLNFLDFEHYRQTGRPSIGLRYEAWPMGPVPSELERELTNKPKLDMVSAVLIKGKKNPANGKLLRMEFQPKKGFDQSLFSKRELRIMRELTLYFRDSIAEDMSEFSHLRGLPWREVYRSGVGNRQTIPYDLALKSEPLTEGGTIAEDELAYRREALKEVVEAS